MSDNPFALSNIEQGGGAAAPANDNPFAISSIERDQQADLRVELQRAVRTNPDQAARAAHLAKKYPVPQDVLARNLQDVEFQAAVDAADERLRTSPTLAKAMRDGKSWLAPQAHDDVEPLAQVEQFFRDTGGSVKAGVFNASKGAAGVFRAGFELVAPALDILEPVTAVGGNPLRRLAEGFALQAEAAGASAKAATPQTSNVVSAGFQSGIQSLTQNLLTLPMAFAPGGQAAALGGMTAFTGGQSYQDAREKGLPMSQALPFAASQAAIEYATEKLPLGQLLKDVKVGTPIFQTLTNQLKGEVVGEQVATVLQDLNEWAVLNPEKPFSSYLEERPSAAAQTLVATIVGAGGNVAVVKGIETVVNRAVNGSRQIQEAERTSAGLQTALQAAAASKLRERNPETFKQLVQTMAEESGGDMSSVFIDAQTLAQTGVNVAEVFPSAAEQMDAALAANGSVEVSIAEVLTAVPGTPLEQVFLQNARGTADGLSLAEAQQAFEQADRWTQEADRVMAEAQDQQAWQTDADAVKTTLLEQLNTAGRFTPDVNEAYATLVRDFYSVMAGRQGVTPQEMYARYPLRVTAGTSQNGAISGGTLSGKGDDQAVLAQTLVNGLGLSSKKTANIFKRVAKLSESDRLGSVPALQPVLTEMRRAILDNPQVLDAVVRAIPVDVVNNLAGSEAAAKVLLHDEAMLKDSTAFNADLPIPGALGDAASSVGLLVREAALRTAELSGVSLGTGLKAQEGSAAVGASEGDGFGQNESFQQMALASYSPSQILITLNESANLSSFLHESGHFFLEVMADLASQPNAPADAQADMAALLKWFDVPDLQTWQGYTLDQKRQYHERFAESFEQYLLEGRAPTTELQPLFRKFRSWLVNVYKSLTQFMRGRDLKLNDETRKVFDRMLATDEQIRQAEEAAGMLPDFDATNEAIEKLQARSLRDMKWAVGARSRALKALQKQAKELRKGVETEVRAEVDAMPEFAAQRDLDKLRKENKRQPNDVEMAVVAEAHGFATTEAMLKAITDVGKKADVIEGMTDQRMLERHGDLIDQRAIEDAATEAVHNAVRARVLATELKAQADALNPRQDTGRTASNGRAITVNALTEAAKQFAQNVVARRRVTDLRKAAAQHRAAEARAGKRWQEATAAGKTQDAVAAKRDQLLNNYTVKAALEAQAEVKKITEFFARVTKGGNEKLVERGRDPDVVNAMRAILAAYDVAPRLEKAATEYMEVVARNDPAMYGALQPSVQGALQNAKPVAEMTVEELRGLAAEMQSMWHLAKRSRQMEIDGNLLDREDLEDDLIARMTEIGIPDTIPGEKGAITASEEAGIKLQFAKALLTRAEQWTERMDGKFGGPFLRYIFQPIKEAADRYRTQRTAYREKFAALVEAVAPTLKSGPIAAPELGYTFGNAKDSGMAELLHAILHTGNESNRRKLLLGRQWATENADGTLDTSRWDAFIQRMIDEGNVTKVHYDFAQGVWDLLEETKPGAQRAHREVFGRYFAEVTADEFDTPFGKYRGGYVPAQTDSRIVTEAKLRDLAEGENESMAYAFPAAPSGFTKSRVDSYAKPLLLDLRALPQHIDKVLLFSNMQPAVNDVRRLLTSKRVSYALDRVAPGIYEGMLTPWLKRSAQQTVETPVMGDRKLSRFFSAARSRAGMALMFANVSNTVQQITGFSLAAVKVKPSLMMSSLAQFVAHPKQTKRAVADASPFMRDRMLNEVSAMNNAVEEILVNPNLYERSQAWTQQHAYFMQSAVDNTMAPIIWTAAYNQAVGEKMGPADAVRFADGVIRQTQGSTLPEDVSRFETGPAYGRLFTQFIGYFNMMANTNATAISQIVGEMGLRKGAGKLLYVALAGLMVPIWVAESIALAFKGGPDDEDRDGYLDDWLAAVFGVGSIKGLVAQVPVVGMIGQGVVNRFNTNPADDKFSLSPAVSLIESTVNAPFSVYKAIVDDGNAQKAVRDAAAAATMITGLPFYAAARPIGYGAGVAQGKIDPTDEVDAVRGFVTGTASKESKN